MTTHGQQRCDASREIGADLDVSKATLHANAGGAWIRGSFKGHRFDALVFRNHAANPDYEIADSRISKLWVERMSDRVTVYHWDRGLIVEPATEMAGVVVGLLTAGLAEMIYAD